MDYYKELEFLNKKIGLIDAKISYFKIAQELGEENEQKDLKPLEIERKNLMKKIRHLLDKGLGRTSILDFTDRIIQGDCMDYLPKIPLNSVDVFISDIPYGISLDEWDVLHKNTNSALLGVSPAQEGKSGFKKRGKPINGWNKDDRNINKEYEDWVFKWAQQVFPIMKEGSPLFVFGARRTLASAIVAFERAGFLVKDVLSWEKSNAHHRSQDILKVILKRGSSYKINKSLLEYIKATPKLSLFYDVCIANDSMIFNKWSNFISIFKDVDAILAKKFTYELLEKGLDDQEIINDVNTWRGWKLGNLAPYYEPIAVFMKPYDSVVTLTDNVLVNQVGAMNIEACKIDGKEPNNILKFDFDKKEEKLHEAQKPVELIKYLIKLTTLENQVVLDPFVGSGTTAAASKMLNRRYISFELGTEYHAKASERLNSTEVLIEENEVETNISIKVAPENKINDTNIKHAQIGFEL